MEDSESDPTNGTLSGFADTFGLYSIGVVNLLICLVGLGGNALVFYVILRFSAMRTITNVFILALALADIAFLVHIPLLVATSVLGKWPFGNLYCKIYYSVTTINQFASSFFLVTMSADRFIAICLPWLSRRLRTNKAALLICMCVWSLAIALMYPVFAYSGTETYETEDSHAITQCNIIWPDYNATNFELDGTRAFAMYCFVLGYAVPVLLMLFFYGMVLHSLRANHDKISTTSSTQATANSVRRRIKLRRVTMMIFVVILVFLLCWTPYWVFQLFIVFYGDEEAGYNATIVFTCLSLQCLCFANSAINPILYAVLSENFKQSYAKAFKRIAKFRPANRYSENVIAQGPSTVPEFTGTPVTASVHLLNPPQHQIKLWLKGDALFQVGSGILVLL